MPAEPNAASIHLAADVLLVRADDGSARLLDLDGSFYALSSIGVEMLQGAIDHGVDATVQTMARAYRTDTTMLRADMEKLLGQLAQARLIGRAGTHRTRRFRDRLRLGVTRAVLRGPVRQSPIVLLLFARVCFSLFGWSGTVDAWRRVLERSSAARDSRDASDLRVVDDAVRNAAARLPSVNCKERALTAWFILAGQGLPATLVVGIQWFPLAGHCWCEVGATTLTDTEGHCRTFQPVARYALAGAADRLPVSAPPVGQPVGVA